VRDRVEERERETLGVVVDYYEGFWTVELLEVYAMDVTCTHYF
jgi:hypothetical protein